MHAAAAMIPQNHPLDSLKTLFLNLLEADAKFVAELGLGDMLLDAPQSNSLSQLNVGFAGTTRFEFHCR